MSIATLSAGYRFDPGILREYDVRGIVGKTLSVDDARALGKAFGTWVVRKGGKRVCVGLDGRISSPSLEGALTEGLLSTGLQVERVGVGPTSMLYFSVLHLGADAGVMVTGSHNPPDYNGFKMAWGKMPVYGQDIQKMGAMAAAGDFVQGKGSVTDVDVRQAYTDRLLKDYEGGPMTVAWDAGNGATAEIMKELCKRLPGIHHPLFDTIDGRFPNHHPDPTIPENLVDLQKTVREKKCQLGIAFDGDGDRIGAVDHNGDIVWGDQLIAIYAREVLKTHPGAPIIGDVKCSQTLYDEIARLGGEPVMWKSGHSLVKARMAELKSPLAGEMSGHIFFGDKWYGFDDALYCAVRLISLVSRSGETLAQMRDAMPRVYNTPEVRFQVDESRKFAIAEEVTQRVQAAGGNALAIDGVRVTTPDGWWLLRASNTQDVLTVRAESRSPEGLERLKQSVTDQLKASGIMAPF
ncbi:MAG: phosphomannomutase/phosphoglucomutase [Pseudomonadota bacterium]|nr:phosphomannomutase/phosphoglucomutase [Pseudomonadota bacterium]